jgi:hypothetical protein
MKPEHLWMGTVCLVICTGTALWIGSDGPLPAATVWLWFAGLGIGVLPIVVVGLMSAWSAVRTRAERWRRGERGPRSPSDP